MTRQVRSHPYDVGVLLVHGIGLQRKGETLQDIAESLIPTLEARLRGVARKGQPPPEASCRVEMRGVRLHQTERETPAHAELRLGPLTGLRARDSLYADATTSHWLVAESWWAEEFYPPAYRDVLRWTGRVPPTTLVSHFASRARYLYRGAAGVAGKKVGRAEAALALGNALLQRKEPTDTEAAEEFLRRAMELGSIQAALHLGALLNQRDATQEARKAFQRAVILARKHGGTQDDAARALLALAAFLEEQGERRKAQAVYAAASATSAAAEHRYVTFLVARQDFATAKVLATHHRWWQSPEAALTLVRWFIAEGCPDEAKTVLARFDTADSVDLLLTVGQLYEGMGEENEADWRYRTALQQGSGMAAVRLAHLLTQKGDAEGAAHALRRARILGTTPVKI